MTSVRTCTIYFHLVYGAALYNLLSHVVAVCSVVHQRWKRYGGDIWSVLARFVSSVYLVLVSLLEAAALRCEMIVFPLVFVVVVYWWRWMRGVVVVVLDAIWCVVPYVQHRCRIYARFSCISNVRGCVRNIFRPEIRRDYPLNLSILLSGGKENNNDSLSNGEWRGKSSKWKSGFL